MPTLPVYDAQRNIQATPAAPMRDEAAFPFQLQQQVAGALGEINEKWMQSQATMQYTEAKAKFEVGLAEIQSRAAADPDLNNSGQYLDEVKKLRQISSAGIKDVSVKNRAALEFDYGSQIAGIKITSGFQDKQMKYNKSALNTSVNTLLQKSMSADTPAEKMNTRADIENLLQINLANGTINQFERDEILEEAKVNVARFDAQYNPDRFLENKNDYGLNTEKNAEVTALAEKVQKSRDKEMEALKEEEQKQNVINFTEAFLKGELPNISISDIYKRIETGQLPTEFGHAFVNAITQPKLTKQEIEEDQLLSVLDKVLEVDGNRGFMQVVTSAMKKTGKTSQKELNALMKFATENLQDEKRGIVQNALGFIKKWGESMPNTVAIDAMMNFVNNINNGDTPVDAKKKAEYQTATEHNPFMMNISDNGTVMVDPVTGVRKRVFRDGRIEDVK